MVDTQIAYAGWQFVLLEPFANPAWKLRVDDQPIELTSPRVFSRYQHHVEVWEESADGKSRTSLLAGFRKLVFPPQRGELLTTDLNRYAPGQSVYVLCACPDVAESLVLQLSCSGAVQLEMDLLPTPTGLVTERFTDLPEGSWIARLYTSEGVYLTGCPFFVGEPGPPFTRELPPLAAQSGPMPDGVELVRFPMPGYEMQHWFCWTDRSEGFRIVPRESSPGPLLEPSERGVVSGPALVVACRPGGEGASLCELELYESLAHSRMCAEYFNAGPLHEYELRSRGELLPMSQVDQETGPSAPAGWAEVPPVCPVGVGPGSDFQLCCWTEGGELELQRPCLVRAYQLVNGRVGCTSLRLD